MTTNNNVTVSLTSELRLEQALKEAGVKDPAAITKLTVSGPIVDSDFEYLNINFGETLQELDMRNASFDDETGFPYGVLDNCTGLDAIVLPESFIGIPWGIYTICSDLTSVTISGQSLHYLLMNEALADDDDEEYDDDDEDFDDDDDDDEDEDDFDFGEDDFDEDFDLDDEEDDEEDEEDYDDDEEDD